MAIYSVHMILFLSFYFYFSKFFFVWVLVASVGYADFDFSIIRIKQILLCIGENETLYFSLKFSEYHLVFNSIFFYFLEIS